MTCFTFHSAQILRKSMNPTVGLCGTLPVAELSELPSLHRVPEVQDFATSHKHSGAIPDPLRSVAHNDYHRLGVHPSQFPQLRIQPRENGVGISQTVTESPHYRAPPRRDFYPFAGQQ